MPDRTASFPTIRAVSCVIAHTPGLLRYGSKPARELAKDAALLAKIEGHLRSFDDAVAYAPNQVFIGSRAPEWLWDVPEPWWRHGDAKASARGPVGQIVSEDAFWGLLRMADEFGLVDIESGVLDRSRDLLRSTGLFTDAELERIARASGTASGEGALGLHGADGSVVGHVANGYPGDTSQTADILLENLACKASGALALKQLLRQTGMDARDVEYVLGCGEEAVGDRYQRGGGAISKAMAEMAGCAQASGSDVKAFCCAPVHALVLAGSLVQSGVFKNVVVVGGGSLAKLGMKMLGHLAKDMPLLEDCLAAVAILVGPPDGTGVRMRLDAVGRHTVASGGSAGAIYEALVAAPLDQLGLHIPDVDKYAVELHNPDITVPAGSGNVPRTNYRIIAGLGVMRGELRRDDVDGFERVHGVPGFVPTQGHIPAALPYLAHALPRLRDGSLRNALFIAKGSLFLGKMTNMADGMSVLLDRAD
ncbi:MAG TPA: glycine/sarcosine/betaine reductase complex component C subunit beta [Candidatus Limnocylindria bacterium]|nr:glycine/sarcosine/betaine reductase complex component C subunit beta [Candidatus Limnocylindria bacterium]